MPTALLSLDLWYTGAPVNRRTFDEHMGRSVYAGIVDPGDPTADENVFCAEVHDLVRELSVTAVRRPVPVDSVATRGAEAVGLAGPDPCAATRDTRARTHEGGSHRDPSVTTEKVDPCGAAMVTSRCTTM